MTIRINWSLFLAVTLAVVVGIGLVFALVTLLQACSHQVADCEFENRKRIGFTADSMDTVTKPMPA